MSKPKKKRPTNPVIAPRFPRVCVICKDPDRFHVHNEGKRIDDYFTVGRGMSDFEAAQYWKDRALAAESLTKLLDQVAALFPDENSSGGTYNFTLGKFVSGWVFSVVNDWHTWLAANRKYEFRFYATPNEAVRTFLSYIEENRITPGLLMR